MAARKQLSEEAKRFIVRSLAVYETPSEVMLAVKEKFKITLTRGGVQNYDPTKIAGEDLSTELKALFFEARKEFDEKEIVPVSKKNVRLKKLGKYVEFFENSDNYLGAATVLEQIAKEEGGMFTNRRELTGRNGEPMQIAPVSLADWKAEQQRRRDQAANTKEMFTD